MKFLDALIKDKNTPGNTIIPDIKCYSPKEGDLMRGRSPVEVAAALVKAGAPVLSVVTEEKNFHGSVELLKRICRETGVPVLRKDFITSKHDLIATVDAGASAVLLMCSCLSEDKLTELYEQACELGLDVLFETHVPKDFQLARRLQAPLIGINNRDILQLERDNGDVTLTESLISLAPEDAYLVTESSISSAYDVQRAMHAGANAALVGTAILSAANPAAFYSALRRRVNIKICGTMDKVGIDVCVKYGIDTLGFVVEYPKDVPWNLSAEQAKPLLESVPQGFKKSVVTGGCPDKVIALCKELRPDIVQLHYRETLSETAVIAKELRKIGISVIKTVPLDPNECKNQFGTDNLEKIALALNDIGIFAILVDSREAANADTLHGVTPFDTFKNISLFSKLPVILAGGITADNIESVLEKSGARWIDIMTGSEDSPGKKSEEKISAIICIAGGI